jgi:hypothetical protein
MSFKSLSENLETSGEKTQEYLENTIEYYKLRTFKTITKGAISLVNFLIIGIILLLALLFLSIGVALWLGDLLDSRYVGHFIVGGFYILVILLFLIFAKKPIQKTVLLKFSDIFFDNDDDPEMDVASRLNQERINETNTEDEV